MGNRRLKIGLFIVFIVLQVAIHRYVNVIKLNLDLLYLILVYISVKSGFMKTVFSAAAIGLVTDFFSMQDVTVSLANEVITKYDHLLVNKQDISYTGEIDSTEDVQGPGIDRAARLTYNF